MPTPTYRDVVRPALIDTNVPSNGKAEAAQALASTFDKFAQFGNRYLSQISAEQGRRAGAEAGRTDHPGFRTGFAELTAYGRAYNDSATRSYAIKSEIAADEAATRLENEAGNDPETFRETFGAWRDEILKNAPEEARPILSQVYDQRMAMGMKRIIQAQADEIHQQARTDVSEGIARANDRIAQYLVSNDPAQHALAEEEQVKLDLLIDGAAHDGTISKTEAAALRVDSTRRVTEQVVTYRFRDEMDNPYGDPIGFIQNLRERNKTSEALPPAEEEKLMGSLLQDLREHNALEAMKGKDGTRKARWDAGNQAATSLLLQGKLSIRKVQQMVDDDEIDPDVARTLRNELLEGKDRPDDNAERFRVETTLLDLSEDDIAHDSKLSWQTRRELVLKRRDWLNGWRGTQQAREAADRIDRALGILPGTDPRSLSRDSLTKRERALTQWYNEVDALPPDERRTKAISSAETIINNVIRTDAQKKIAQNSQRISEIRAEMAKGQMDEEELKQAEKTIANYERLIKAAEQTAAGAK